MDTRTPEQRRRIMQSVKSRNTGPELVVRRTLSGLGTHFRLHRKDLSGAPDIVMPGRKAAIFVNGCFWHGHVCSKGRLPKSNLRFWRKKIERNKERDSRSIASLKKDGWRVLTVWQCDTKDEPKLARRLSAFLARPRKEK